MAIQELGPQRAADQPERDPGHPGPRIALTREQVMVAALTIVDEGGVEALTMRRLGQALGRNPMAVYRHAADKNDLLDGVVEQVAVELAAGPANDPDDGWEVALRRMAHRFRQVALAHPRVVPLLVTRPLAGPLALRPPATLRPVEELLELFITAGFDPAGALHATRLFTGFLYGHVLHELQERIHDADETDDVLRLGLHRLPRAEFPRLRSLATELAAYDGAAELDEGLEIVLAGLRNHLRRCPRGDGPTGPVPAPGPAQCP